MAKYLSAFEPEESLSGDVKQQIGSSKTVQTTEQSWKTQFPLTELACVNCGET